MDSFRNFESSESVQVVVRCRPMNHLEVMSGFTNIVEVLHDESSVAITDPNDTKEKKVFTFDAVYDSNTQQEQLYEGLAKPLVESIFDGFNGTIFAYGQTGTGKTYTMEGSRMEPSKRGIIPQSFDQIFECIYQSKDMEYLVRSSYLEIYMEEVRDLLCNDTEKKYQLRERPDFGVTVLNLSSCVCSNAEELHEVMLIGNQNRSVGATNMNEHSSRSHAIFIISIEMEALLDENNKIIRVGKLNLVDLAGSERINRSGTSGERLKEAAKINLSLSALGNVIAALIDDKKLHIPYRDSKLTRLLQDSLGGNSKTIMIANIGPASAHYEETITTLRYASRAKAIKNKPRINENPKDALLREYKQEIQRLKTLIAERAIERLRILENQNEELSPSGTDSEEAEEEQMETEIMYSATHFENQRIMKNIENMRSEIEQERKECEEIETKIKVIETRLSDERGSAKEVSEEDRCIQVSLRKKIESSKRSEDEVLQALVLLEERADEVKRNCARLEMDLIYKERKFLKASAKLSHLHEQFSRLKEQFMNEREELRGSLDEVRKDLKLKMLVVNSVVPPEQQESVRARLVFDVIENNWVAAAGDDAQQAPLKKRPVSRSWERRPACNRTVQARTSSGCYRYRSENILSLQVIQHARTTYDYVRPTVPPQLKAVLAEALSSEGDLNVDALVLKNRRKKTRSALTCRSDAYDRLRPDHVHCRV